MRKTTRFCLLLSMLVASTATEAEKIRHEEKNGFVWYEDITLTTDRHNSRRTERKVDITDTSGKALFSNIENAYFLCADKDDSGLFFIQKKYAQRNEDGLYTRDGRLLSPPGMLYHPGREKAFDNQRFKTADHYYTVLKKWESGVGNTYGVMDDDGRIVIPVIYKRLQPTLYSDSRILNGFVAVGETIPTEGLIGLDGKTIIAPEKSNQIDIKRNLIEAKIGNTYALLDLDGNFIVRDARAVSDRSPGFEVVSSTGKRGLLDDNGSWVITPDRGYTDIYSFTGKDDATYYKVKSATGKWGIVNAKGAPILPCDFSDIYYIGGDFYKFRSGDAWGVVDGNSKVIIPTSRGYTYIGDYSAVQKTIPFTKTGYKGECNAAGRQIALRKDTSQSGAHSSSEAKSSVASAPTVLKDGRYPIVQVVYNSRVLPPNNKTNYLTVQSDVLRVYLDNSPVVHATVKKREKDILGEIWEITVGDRTETETMTIAPYDKGRFIVGIGNFGYVVATD